jgi:hypothetical protein
MCECDGVPCCRMLMCVALPWVDLHAGRIGSLSLLQLLCFARSITNMLLEVEALC